MALASLARVAGRANVVPTHLSHPNVSSDFKCFP